MEKKHSVMIAMSGGIDSSVTAFLLKEDGYQVTGIYFSLIDDDKEFEKKENNGQCRWNCGRQRARITAHKLNIPLFEIDYREKFKEIIIKDFIAKYRSGITPNPCILCNERVKFRLLLDQAIKNNIDFIATGHYVRVEKRHDSDNYILKRGLDRKKDQSYFLYRLKKDVLSKCIFPLGKLQKEDVEKIASELGLEPSNIKESQEICFIQDNDYRDFIKQNDVSGIDNKEGNFVDLSGKTLGKHKGIAFYTIGQRRKIGLSMNTRKYIVSINTKNNNIVIGDEIDLYRKEFEVIDVEYISAEPIIKPTSLGVQIRYNSTPSSAEIFPLPGKKVRVIYEKPKRAITPGQSAVFYKRDTVIGGGMISL